MRVVVAKLAVLLSSLLFVAVHLPGWLSLHLFTIHNIIFVFVFGVLMAILLVSSKSLWAPIVYPLSKRFPLRSALSLS